MILERLFKNKKEINDMEYSDKERIDNEIAKNKLESKEVWRDVVNYERWYEVSDKGNVRKVNRDGSTKLLKAKPNAKGKTVGLRKLDEVRTHQISHLVADAFGVKPTSTNKNCIYHIDGDVNNDTLSNLTYDKKETEKYIKEHKVIKDLRENNKQDLINYVENNKVFLQQAKEKINSEVTLKDINDTLEEMLKRVNSLEDINNSMKEILYLLRDYVR